MTPVTQPARSATIAPETTKDSCKPAEPLAAADIPRRVAELRLAALGVVTPEDVAGIMRALIKKACEGHVQACKLVLAYTLGKPLPADVPAAPRRAVQEVCQPVPDCDRPPSPVGDNGPMPPAPSRRERESPGNFFVDLDLVPPLFNGKIRPGRAPDGRDNGRKRSG